MTIRRHRKKVAKRQKVFTIGLVVLTFLVGIVAGQWWSVTHSTINQVTSELQRTNFDLAKTKFEMEKVSKISEIHNNIEIFLLKIFDAYRKHSKIVQAADKNVSKNKKDKTQRELEIMWESEFLPLKDDLTQLENTLSELEKREPRDFNIFDHPPMMSRESKK